MAKSRQVFISSAITGIQAERPSEAPPPDLTALRVDCAAQMEHFRSQGANDPTPCLLLFHKAILHRDPVAWEALVAVYRPHVESWVRRRGFAADANLLDELVQEALVRFWRAYTPEQLARARSLADILRYWQDCATCACLDWLRRGRNAPDSLEETDNRPIPKTLAPDALQHDLMRAEARGRLWQLVAEQCQDEADRTVAHRIFVEGQRPRDVLRENPDQFESIDMVYRRLRNLKDRLRRAPDLLDLLKTCC
jgi:DNA-directed RNA polymerase specialized sigma24 family protein